MFLYVHVRKSCELRIDFRKLSTKLVIVTIVASLVIDLFLWLLDYNQVLELLITNFGISEQRVFESTYFTPRTFFIGSSIFGLLSMILILFRSWFFRRVHYQLLFFKWFYYRFLGVIKTLSSLPTAKKKMIVGIPLLLLGFRIFQVYHFPFFIDEVFSYVYFVDKGVCVSATYYPGPNNHVLYNMICSILHYAIASPVLAMRLPSVFIGVFFFPLGIGFMLKYWEWNKSFMASLLLQVSFNFSFYSFQGRGYLLHVILCVLLTLSLYKSRTEGKQLYWLLFEWIAVLGFLTVPIFLYPFTAVICFYILSKGWDYQYIRSGLRIVLVTIFCYSPIFLFNGVGAIFQNEWVQSLPFKLYITRLPEYFVSVQDWLWDWKHIGSIASAIFIALYIFLMKQKIKVVYYLSAMIFVLLIISLQRVLPFPRVWISASIVQVILIVEVVSLLKKYKYLQLSIALIVFGGFLYSNVVVQGEIDASYAELPQLKNDILISESDTVFCKDDFYLTYARLYSEEEGNSKAVVLDTTQAVEWRLK